MKNVAIAGASGLVGTHVLRLLLAREDIGRVTALGRRELPLQHPRLTSKIVDLGNGAALARELPDGLDAAFCCLGTTMKRAGSKEAFRAIDFDAVLAFAEAARAKGARRFLLVSSIGADARSGNFYLKSKGEAEEAVARLGFAHVTVLRPSFIDDLGERAEYRAGERLVLPLARAVFAVIGRTRRYAPITPETIAKAMVTLAFTEGPEGVRIVQSEQIQSCSRT